MLKRIVALCAIAISACGFLPGESKPMSDYNQAIIFIGCSPPGLGTSGMTVYSIEAVGWNGKRIATDFGATKAAAGDVIGQSCSGILNKLIAASKRCMLGMYWVPMHQPIVNPLNTASYGLNLFSLMRDYSSASPM